MDFDLLDYDRYIVSFSGGKDSTACLLYLLDNRVPKEKIELWHQEIDGRGPSLFDWEVTPDYCRKVGEALGIPVLFQWKEGGFTREMLRDGSLTAPIHFELPDGTMRCVGGEKGKPSTRRRFPQPSPDLRVRWCSAYLKIDVCAAALRHDPRFQDCRTLVLSGERGEESRQRAGYAVLEGTYWRNTESGPIPVTLWDSDAAPANSASSATSTSSPVQLAYHVTRPTGSSLSRRSSGLQ